MKVATMARHEALVTLKCLDGEYDQYDVEEMMAGKMWYPANEAEWRRYANGCVPLMPEDS